MAKRTNKKKAGAKKKAASKGGYKLPPFLSFDPGITSDIEAAKRGFSDLRGDTKRDTKRTKQDFRFDKRNLKIERGRGQTDLATQLRRGVRDIGYERQDLQTDASRGRQDLFQGYGRGTADFNTQLKNLALKYQGAASQQGQAANAAGITGGSYARAAAAARAGAEARERQPIDTGKQRLESDFRQGVGRINTDVFRGLGRLGAQESELRFDVGQGQQRLGQDYGLNLKSLRRSRGRTLEDLETGLQRGLREKRQITGIDLPQQAIFQARERRPGVFNKSGIRSGGRRKRRRR